MLTHYVRMKVEAALVEHYTKLALHDKQKFHQRNIECIESESARNSISINPDPSKVFFCVRVYPDGSAKYTVRDEAGTISWLIYNMIHRGNALFVDGHMYSHGEISSALRHHIESILQKDQRFMQNKSLKPEQMRWITSTSEPSRTRYPDDAEYYPNFQKYVAAKWKENAGGKRP